MANDYVTRTIKATKATFMGLNVSTGESFTKTVIIAKIFKDDAKLLKALKESNDTDEMKVVHVVSQSIVEELRGVPEDKFIRESVRLDPVTRKPL